MNFPPGGIQYPRYTLDGTTEAATETEAAAASTSSDLEKNFRSHSNEIGEGEGEGTRFYFLSFSPEEMRHEALVACEIFIGREFSWNSRYLEP